MTAKNEVEVFTHKSFKTIEERDPELVTRKMGDRILAAESLDALFDALEGNNSQRLIGKTVEITAVDWDEYETESGPIPLAACTAIDCSTGEEMEFATTAQMLTRFIFKAETLGAMPFKVRIEGKKTRSGQTALNFVRP